MFMKVCRYCGSNSEGIFCSTCGRRLESADSIHDTGVSCEIDLNSDSSVYLLLEVSSFKIGFRDDSVSECRYIYSDGSYIIRYSILLADGSEKELDQKGSLSTDEFHDMLESIKKLNWPDSRAMVDGGRLSIALLYDNAGNVIHFGDSITINSDTFFSMLPKSSVDTILSLKEAYRQSEKQAAKSITKRLLRHFKRE